MFPKAAGRTGDIPYVGDGEPVSAVIIARSAIEFQPTLCRRDRSQVHAARSLVVGAETLTGTVNAARPSVGSIRLEAARKAAIQPPLHGVVGGISLTGETGPDSKIRMKTLLVY